MADAHKVLIEDAKSFSERLETVTSYKRRDAQTQHFLEKAKTLLDELVKDYQKPKQTTTGPGRAPKPGLGQLWVKLDEMKRENAELKKQLTRGHGDKTPTSPKPVTVPGDEIIADLHRTRSECELLRLENEQLQKCSKELETVNASLKDDYRRHKTALDTAQVTLANVVRENRQLETNVEIMAREREQLEISAEGMVHENTQLKTKAEKMVSENTHLKKDLERFRSSAQHTPIKIRADNRRFENISEKCRPSVIAMKYNALESQEWMEAKESLEDTSELGEDAIVRFLSSLLINVYDASLDMYNFMSQALIDILRRPTLTKDLLQADIIENAVPIDSIEQMPELLVDAVHSVLRQNWENVDSKPITEEALTKCTETNHITEDSAIRTKAVERFMVESARLCWQMIIQQPPMVLAASDTCYNETRHKLWWSCDQSRAAEIQYYVWPTLYDYEGGNTLVKGCVFCE